MVGELDKRRMERECIPNTRGVEASQRLGAINLVTAIGFEVARRNARMILDRSPEDQPLIPSERTKIRVEMRRGKENVNLKSSFESPYQYNPRGEAELIEEESDAMNVVREVREAGKSNFVDKLLSIDASKISCNSKDEIALDFQVDSNNIGDQVRAEIGNENLGTLSIAESSVIPEDLEHRVIKTETRGEVSRAISNEASKINFRKG